MDNYRDLLINRLEHNPSICPLCKNKIDEATRWNIFKDIINAALDILSNKLDELERR